MPDPVSTMDTSSDSPVHVSADVHPEAVCDSVASRARAFFRFLEREVVPYSLLGNPDAWSGNANHDADDHDVDIALPPRFTRNLGTHLLRFADSVGARVVQFIQHEPTAWFAVLAWTDGNRPVGHDRTEHPYRPDHPSHPSHPDRPDPPAHPAYLELDLCSDYVRYGRRYLSAAELLDGREEQGGVWVPPARARFAYYLIKKIEKQDLDETHGAYLSREWALDPEGARAWVHRLWRGEQADRLCDAAAHGDWERIGTQLVALRQGLRGGLGGGDVGGFGRGRVGSGGVRGIGPAASESARKVRRVLRPTGLWVAFLGPDGSGKSSVIDRILERPPPLAWGSSYFHLRPDLGGGDPHGSAPVVDPHGTPPRSALGSVLKLIYYWVDYTLGYVLSVRPKLARSQLVVFDRYYHDLLVDPRRYRYGGPTWWARLLGRTIPSPDLFLYLDAPPDDPSGPQAGGHARRERSAEAGVPGPGRIPRPKPGDRRFGTVGPRCRERGTRACRRHGPAHAQSPLPYSGRRPCLERSGPRTSHRARGCWRSRTGARHAFWFRTGVRENDGPGARSFPPSGGPPRPGAGHSGSRQ